MYCKTRALPLTGVSMFLLCISGTTLAKDKVTPEELAAETAERIAADTQLQSNIDSEVAARIDADNQLQSNIDSETADRKAGDNQLQSNINSLSSELETLEGTVSSLASNRLYAVSNTVNLPTAANANMVAVCNPGDRAVGGSCRYSIDPETNNTTIVRDGLVFTTDAIESWNCVVLNFSGIQEISVTTNSICVDLTP